MNQKLIAMKKTITIASIAILSLGIFACTSSSKKESSKDQTIEGEVDPTTNNSPEIEAITAQQKELQLNDGKKWKVNEEMVPIIKNAESALENYSTSNSTNDDYLALAEQLRMSNDQLMGACTMQGEAHEQLHHWLHPNMELINALTAGKSDQENKNLVAAIQHSYELYHQYFD